MAQKAYFEHFGGLGSDMARMGLRTPILSILATLAQIGQNGPQKTNFEQFGSIGPDIGRNGPQKAYFEHLARWPPKPRKLRGFWATGRPNPVNYEVYDTLDAQTS